MTNLNLKRIIQIIIIILLISILIIFYSIKKQDRLILSTLNGTYSSNKDNLENFISFDKNHMRYFIFKNSQLYEYGSYSRGSSPEIYFLENSENKSQKHIILQKNISNIYFYLIDNTSKETLLFEKYSDKLTLIDDLPQNIRPDYFEP